MNSQQGNQQPQQAQQAGLNQQAIIQQPLNYQQGFQPMAGLQQFALGQGLPNQQQGVSFPPQASMQNPQPGNLLNGQFPPQFPNPMNPMGMGMPNLQYPQMQMFQMPSSLIGENQKLQEKDKMILKLNEEIDQLNKQIEEQKYEHDKAKRKLERNANEELEDLKNSIQTLQNQSFELENRNNVQKKQIQALQLQLQQQKEESNNIIQDLESNLDEAKAQIYSLQSQKQQNNLQNQFVMPVNINNDQSDRYKKELDEVKRKNTALEKQLSMSNNNMKSQADTQLYDLQQQIDKIENARQEFMRENENLRKQIQQLKKDNNVSTESMYNLQNQLRESDNKYKQEKKKNEELQLNVKARDQQIVDLEQLFKKMQDQPQARSNAGQQELLIQFQNLQQRNQNQQELEKQKEEKLKQEMLEEQKRREERLKGEVQFDILEKQRKRNQAKLIQQRMIESHGQMDVCFLVDTTASMDPYKEQTRQCIKGSMSEIKRLTNRDTSFACVCYQDFAEFKANKQQYQQFDFTKDTTSLENWLNKIQCTGGDDQAEDIKGGIMQMCQKLKWTNRFKIAILICDAPCHGAQYHDNSISDRHKHENITEAITLLIKQEILLIGLNFKSFTTIMYEQIRKIFVDQKREELFMLVDMQNTPLQQIALQMVKQIGQASQNATQTNNNSTRSKQQAQDQKQAKDGAMEALCKQGNFLNFETKVKTVDVKFIVFRTEIKADSLERNLKTIQNISTYNDYQNIQEGFWDCIRTEKPFAYGMMKAVFLMKKKSNLKDELYVIKTPLSGRPYTSMDEALKECKSHLICQQLMKKFYKDLQSALQKKNILKKYQEVVYSDFLILKENDTAFWIAERFFNGEFVKYNNNFGFISDSKDPLNQIAQAFTYYTYFISDFNYMINDVQGVGIYFTDPAVNTKTGDFDDTDMGENGQAMFIANFSEEKKKLCQEILVALDIFENEQGVGQGRVQYPQLGPCSWNKK